MLPLVEAPTPFQFGWESIGIAAMKVQDDFWEDVAADDGQRFGERKRPGC